MKNANSKAEVNNPLPNARVEADEKQGIEMPIFASALQSRKNVEVASAQNRELWQLAQEVAPETAGPIKKSFTRALQNAS